MNDLNVSLNRKPTMTLHDDRHQPALGAQPRENHERVEGRVLVTGATGYIGGRLVPRLLEAGYRVRCLARSPEKLVDREWAASDRVELAGGDLSDSASVARALDGCRAAYYLVHSMLASGADYAEHDRRMARDFAAAASATPTMERIVYLGGLGETGEDLSEHLSSRREVESELASGNVPVTVLRAAMIIGSGSASFEILRYLVERLPVMVTPRWVQTESQPIAVSNVLEYLVRTLEVEETAGRVLDIGGPEVLSYREQMRIMAAALDLPRRLILPVPVLTPRLSSLWIHLVTPLSHRIARPLAEGLRNRVVCRSDEARQLMPQRLLQVRDAIDAALGQYAADHVETSWTDAGPIPGDPDWAGGKTFVDRRSTAVAASPEATFAAVCRIGGGNGWYAADILWRLRGMLDRMVGGPGLRRGRRRATRLSYGDALDFWRVTGIESGRRLELRAEMKLPGEALLEFEVGADGAGSTLVQTARFKPKGLLGLLYWAAVLPLHGFVFRGMLQGIRRSAESAHEVTVKSDNLNGALTL
jgi:uncharacterized protein YbjT (DUF2867 family)